MVRITVTEKGGPIRRFEFDKGEITIGRVQGNDIILAKGNVSKRHARIAAEDGKLVLQDLNSTNGTYVNGKRIAEAHTLRSSDKIFIGDFVIAPEDNEVPVTARRGSGDLAPDKPVDLEDPLSDLVKRRRKEAQRDVVSEEELPPPPPPPLPLPRAPRAPVEAAVEQPRPARPAPVPVPEPAPAPAHRAAAPAPVNAPEPVRPPLVSPDRGAAAERASLSSERRAAPPPEAPRAAQRAEAPEAVDDRYTVPRPPPKAEEPPRKSAPGAGSPALAAVPVPPALSLGGASPGGGALGAGALNAGAQGHAAPPRAAAALSPLDYGRLLGLMRRRLGDRLDLARAGIFGDDLRKRVADAAREVIAGALGDGTVPPAVDTEGLHADLVGEIVGFGPLEELLADPEASEIFVNDASSIYVERGGRVSRMPRAFSSSEALLEVLRRLVTKGGGTLPEDEAVVELRLGDGVRLTAVLPPFAPKGPSFVLRKTSRQLRSLPELVRGGALSESMARFLELCVRARRNLIVSGGSGAGKTALCAALCGLIGGEDRVVVVEESSELALGAQNVVSLEARVAAEDGREVAVRELVRAAMRLRPDWLVIGDCRGAEAFDLVQAMAGGRDGTAVCVTANSARDALGRLEALSALASDASSRGLREAVARGAHVVVHVTRGQDGVRRVTQISEVSGFEGDAAVVHDVFSYASDGRGRFAPTGHIPRFVDELTRRGVALDLSIFRE